ncbi:hypothetical protein PHJA_002200600 [Phtheirospermum japonicum]|uniref:Transmembrane protein n=1 Tax=Phtheirospermum japonicum TaxID=374723 RepID=A0A830CMJ8_9LAMI|nr:hypothetical protein PHJA_002200600 [Phtheirospermum japonicum]
MALAEARAAWQRTANRCLVQEDAKRAPKLACCPPLVTQPVQHTETEPTISDNGQDIIKPNTASSPHSYSNLSPNSRWWLQTQPNYVHQKVVMDEVCQDSRNLESKEGFTCEVSKSSDDVYFDSESSWIGAERNTPWWRTADTGELALLVAQRSVDVLENCDLPRPLNARVKKDMGMNVRCISRNGDEIKPGIGSLVAGNCSPKLWKSAEDRLVFGADRPLRDSPTNDKKPKTQTHEDDSSRAQLLEALRHSQTRAREAEEVMKQACAEKEHVVKLVLRQASQLFAYKQWVHLLQLENMYFQFKSSKIQSTPSDSSPMASPWTPVENRKTQKSWRKSLSRKRAKKARTRCDFGKYAILFALGLGLVGAGLLLGWTIGWMLPTWTSDVI